MRVQIKTNSFLTFFCIFFKNNGIFEIHATFICQGQNLTLTNKFSDINWPYVQHINLGKVFEG